MSKYPTESAKGRSLIRQINTLKAFMRIKKTELDSGSVDCTQCDKKIQFRVAKLNGHVWAKCETSGCIHFNQ